MSDWQGEFRPRMIRFGASHQPTTGETAVSEDSCIETERLNQKNLPEAESLQYRSCPTSACTLTALRAVADADVAMPLVQVPTEEGIRGYGLNCTLIATPGWDFHV